MGVIGRQAWEQREAERWGLQGDGDRDKERQRDGCYRETGIGTKRGREMGVIGRRG